MLYETAARTAEILALNVQDLDLDNRKAPIQ
jgi:integrase